MSKSLKFILFSLFLILFCQIQIFAQCTNPVSPTDGANNVPIPVFFDWCTDPDASSYYIQIYKGGNIISGTGSSESKVTIPNWLYNFSGNTTYQWQMATCTDANAQDCGNFSQKWGFTTGQVTFSPPELITPFYNPSQPSQIPAVNIYDSLEWRSSASYSVYEIKRGATVVAGPIVTNAGSVAFSSIWSALQLNTTYNWHVKSCNDEAGSDCSGFGETWYFKTTGDAPKNLKVDKDIIPVKLDWDDVEKAGSYIYEVSSQNSFAADEIVAISIVENSEATVDYPNLVQHTQYWWHVKTCADKEATICGNWSSTQGFTTFKLATPTTPSPKNNGDFFTYENSISWKEVKGAQAYQYTIDYISAVGETNEDCKSLPPIKIVPTDPPSITLSPRAYIDLECLGEYQWSVRACLDKDCLEVGDWVTPPWKFTLKQPTPPAQFGILPCNRITDNPDTSWNERDSCQLKHIILVLKGIIDLILWRIGLIALALLVAATAVIYFFSLGGSSTLADVKSLWKRAGQGYAIMFLSWLIINFIVKLIGFTDAWWTLPF